MPITLAAVSPFIPLVEKVGIPLLKRFIPRKKIDFIYQGSKQSKKAISLPILNDDAYKDKHWNSFIFSTISDIISLDRYKGNLFIPVPMITILGMRGANFKVIRNNDKKSNYFAKKEPWNIESKDNNKNIIINDNKSIKNKINGIVINTINETMRGGPANPLSYKRLRRTLEDVIKDIKHDSINIYLPSSPKTCFKVGEILKDMTKEFVLFSYYSGEYKPMAKVNRDNSIEFLDVI